MYTYNTLYSEEQTPKTSGGVSFNLERTADLQFPVIIRNDKREIEELKKYIQILQSKIIPIQNLEISELSLKQPIFVNIENDEDNNIVISSSDLNIFGYGETEHEAKRDFINTFKDLYFNLKADQKKLHKSIKPLWSFLQKIVVEN